MFRPLPSRRALFALIACLGILSACASPATSPQTPQATNPEALSPESPPPAAAPGDLQAPATQPQHFTGMAKFRQEALAGYTITLINARSGEPVPNVAELATAKGLAVKLDAPTTDAEGRFGFEVVGLDEGQILRVVVSKGVSSLETIVLSNRRTFAAKMYGVQQTREQLSVDEVTTSLAKIARGVILNMSRLAPASTLEIVQPMLDHLNELSDELLAAFVQQPTLANAIVRNDMPRPEEAAAMRNLVVLANASSLVNALVLETLASIATQTADEFNATYPPALPLLGTTFEAGAGPDGALRVIDSVTGNSVNAASGNLSSISTSSRTGSTGGAKGASTPEPTSTSNPLISEAKIVVVNGGTNGIPADIDGYMAHFKLKGGVIATAARVQVSLWEEGARRTFAYKENVTIPKEGLTIDIPFDVDCTPLPEYEPGQIWWNLYNGWRGPLWLGYINAAPNIIKVVVTTPDDQTYELSSTQFEGDPKTLLRDATPFFTPDGLPRLQQQLNTNEFVVTMRLIEANLFSIARVQVNVYADAGVSTPFLVGGRFPARDLNELIVRPIEPAPRIPFRSSDFPGLTTPARAEVEVWTTDHNIYLYTTLLEAQ